VASTPKPKPAKPEKLTPPKPIETPVPPAAPMPDRVEAPPAPPEPPPVAAPEPSAPAREREPRYASAPSASFAAATTGDVSLPAAPARTEPRGAAPATSASPSTAMAIPGDGITQTAIPRGGYQVRPSYPSGPRRLGIQGTTTLRLFVSADGRVTEVAVEQSAGHPDLDHAAADAVKRWRFEPARRGAEAVGMWVLLPVEFRLK
jgi:periplasmic protein TonB